MEIVKATLSELLVVRNITLSTIAAVYPHYYPAGAVSLFLEYHNDNSLLSDIVTGSVWLCDDGGEYAGTVTVRENEICRLYVLPKHQRKGFGTALIELAEKTAFAEYPEIVLDASLPAKNIYLRRGYVCAGYHIIKTKNGDNLC